MLVFFVCLRFVFTTLAPGPNFGLDTSSDVTLITLRIKYVQTPFSGLSTSEGTQKQTIETPTSLNERLTPTSPTS